MNEILNIPEWAKKRGVIGVILFFTLAIVFLSINTIAEFEIQKFWTDFSPRVSQWFSQEVSIPYWLLLVILLCLIIVSYLGYRLQNRRSRSWLFLPSPRKKGKLGFTKTDVAIAVSKLESQEMTQDDFAETIQQAVNHNKIKPYLGAKYLTKIGYDLILKPDDIWVAETKK